MSTRIINYASFITFLLIFTMQTNAQKSITGVVTEEIDTKDGKFLLHRTTHLPKGKTISGTVMVEPDSDKTKKRVKQIENLNKYILKIGDQIIGNDGIFTMQLPDIDNIPLQVFTSEGKLVQEIPFKLSEPLIPENLKMPKTIRKDFAEKITGDFSGDISNANVLLNEKPVDVLAGNDTELFFKAEEIELGKQNLSLEYDDIKATESVNVVDYTLQAGRLNLNRGESTYLDIKVVGLKDMQESLELKVQNQSVGTVSLEGGDIQTIQIIPEDVGESGIWQKRFDIQSLTRGSFDIYTELEKPSDFLDDSLIKKGDSIPAPDALNPSGPNGDELPQSTVFIKAKEKKKLETQIKSEGDEENNDCCDELRAQQLSDPGLPWGGGVLIFDVGDGKAFEIRSGKIKLFNFEKDGFSLSPSEFNFDFDLEDAFCNISDNSIFSEVTSQASSNHETEDGLTVFGAKFETADNQSILIGSTTNQPGNRDAYVIRFMQQIVHPNGEIFEISVSVSINKETCAVIVQVVINNEYYENTYNL